MTGEEGYTYDDTATHKNIPDYDETAMRRATNFVYLEDFAEEHYAGLEQGMWEEEINGDMEEACRMNAGTRKRFGELRAARGYWATVVVPADGHGQSFSSPP